MSKDVVNPDVGAFIQALSELAPAFDLSLDESATERLSRHYALLVKWNPKIRLTSVINPTEAARIHFLESLYATHYIPTTFQTLADLGSGAGFPGLPISVLRPQMETVLIERQLRKATFLQTVSYDLGLKNLRVFHGRFQDYSPRHFDVVTCRAIERFSHLLPDILSFARTARKVLFFVGKNLAEASFSQLKGSFQVDFFPIPLSRGRILVSIMR